MKFKLLEQKKIGILGFGVTGREVYDCLIADYSITIINDQLVPGYDVVLSEDAPDVDILIKSPGVNYDHPYLKRTTADITNDIELSYLYIQEQQLSTKIVGITGTNGKTTTTQFISDVLGKNATSFPCGNIGKSPLYYLNNFQPDYLVIELSSYQLKQVNRFTPDYSLFLNISPDHLDYHHTFADYLNSKLKLFAKQTFQPLVIPREIVENYQLTVPVNTTYGVDDQVKGQIQSTTIPWTNLKLIINLLQVIGIDLPEIINAVNSFKGLPHRLEIVENNLGITVINDSKATNVNATNAGIATMDKPTILLVGGSVKVEDYTLLDVKSPQLIQVVSYGQAASKFAWIDNVVSFNKFADSVNYCLSVIEPGQTLLFSPCCASFDQHQNYIQRGEEFKKIIKEFNE